MSRITNRKRARGKDQLPELTVSSDSDDALFVPVEVEENRRTPTESDDEEDVAAAADRTGGGIARQASSVVASSAAAEEEKRKVKESLKCSGCGFLCIPPIKTCPLGHLVCAVCVGDEKDKKCPDKACDESAKGPPANKAKKMDLQQCPFAEALLKKSIVEPVACRNFERLGCRAKLPIWEMREHLKRCLKKTIRCFVTKPENCGGRLFSKEKFLEHLIVYHDSKNLRFGQSTSDHPVFIHRFCATHNEFYGSEGITMNVDHVLFKKDIFFLHGVRVDSMMYWWLTILGTEEDGRKYRYRFKIGHTDRPSPEYTFTRMSIHSLDKHTVESIKKTGDFVAVHVAALECFRESGNRQAAFHEFQFDIKIELTLIG